MGGNAKILVPCPLRSLGVIVTPQQRHRPIKLVVKEIGILPCRLCNRTQQRHGHIHCSAEIAHDRTFEMRLMVRPEVWCIDRQVLCAHRVIGGQFAPGVKELFVIRVSVRIDLLAARCAPAPIGPRAGHVHVLLDIGWQFEKPAIGLDHGTHLCLCDRGVVDGKKPNLLCRLGKHLQACCIAGDQFGSIQSGDHIRAFRMFLPSSNSLAFACNRP